MRINKCRACKKNTLKKLFSLGDMCFTGKFPSKGQKIKKEPITLVLCENCELVQLGHNFDLKYLYGPDYGYRTGINKTMLNHVRNVVSYLSKKTKLKNKDIVLDIASNDGSLLNFYNYQITDLDSVVGFTLASETDKLGSNPSKGVEFFYSFIYNIMQEKSINSCRF